MNAFPLYDGKTPLSVSDFTPTLTYYAPTEKKSDACVVIFPGGGYSMRAPHEGDGYARFFQENGIASFVCEYRVKPESFPRPLLDARRAVRYARANAEKYGYSPDKILVMGSSAGGHLASLVSTYRGELEGEEGDSLREVNSIPNGTILCYPVIDMVGEYTHVGSRTNLVGESGKAFEEISTCDILDENTPPAFLWHTNEDGGVHVANSYKYALALRSFGIPAEVHVFPYGRHGLGLCLEDAHVAQWSALLLNWMKVMNF
ncbi:MAG: alpha/beta hydrolase [Clostridia bacterium]|nr:alpha/beta hydrolase [Clostridia bacterium]